jgi:hypothetical protein
MGKRGLFSARLRCCKTGIGALLLAAPCLAVPAGAVAAAQLVATRSTVFHGSDASSPQDAVTVLRGSPPLSAAAERPAPCPDESYYAAGLGCVTPVAPDYASAYPVVGAYEYGIPVFAQSVVVVERRGLHRHEFFRPGRRRSESLAAGRPITAPLLHRGIARFGGMPRVGGFAGFRAAGGVPRAPSGAPARGRHH